MASASARSPAYLTFCVSRVIASTSEKMVKRPCSRATLNCVAREVSRNAVGGQFLGHRFGVGAERLFHGPLKHTDEAVATSVAFFDQRFDDPADLAETLRAHWRCAYA